MRGSHPKTRRARLREKAGAGLLAGLLATGLVACGGGGERQDAAEKTATYEMEIVTSEFPTRQRLAETSSLRLGVENSGDEAIPEVAITISIAGEQGENAIRPFSIRDPQENLAAPDRPVWILENDYPRLVGEDINAGAQTANDKTFAFGELEPGESVEAVWKVTPVKPGDYTLRYEVDAGLQGKAKAETADGGKPGGSFIVQITDVPPQTRVTDDGRVVEIEGGGAPAGDTAPAP